MNHYFEDNRNLKSNKIKKQYKFDKHMFTFVMDNGVFSKDKIDTGSEILLSYLYKEKLNGKILDVGCGYGTIGIILKKEFSSCHFDLIDVAPRAIELARENASLNHCELNILESNVYEGVDDFDYTHIITNPPIRAGKKIIYKIFEGSYERLASHGCLWIVIRKSHGALSAQRKIIEVFGNCEIVKKDKGFYVLKAKKD